LYEIPSKDTLYLNQLRQQIIHDNKNRANSNSMSKDNNPKPSKSTNKLYSKERLKALDQSIQSIKDQDLYD